MMTTRMNEGQRDALKIKTSPNENQMANILGLSINSTQRPCSFIQRMIRRIMGDGQTSQVAWAHNGASHFSIELPSPQSEVLPGISWGFAEEIFTPAFWKYQAKANRTDKNPPSYKIGENLVEELCACLLGGYGMPAELGLAAFQRLKALGLLTGAVAADEIERALGEPFLLFNKPRRYRFTRQKSRFLASALMRLREDEIPTDHRACRDYLTTFAGIGPKTASWIVRNQYGSDEVAILDIHILRAGTMVGIFQESADPARDYFGLEHRFLSFCRAISEPASLIDSLMWDYMRRIGPTRLRTAKAA